MVKVLPKNTAYRRTDKDTVIRAAFYRDFQDLIEAAYDEGAVAGSLALEGDDLIAYLRQELLNVAAFPDPAVLQKDTDLFSLGVDSLQSIRLRTTILTNIDVGGNKISPKFVFEHRSLQAMAEELTRLRLVAFLLLSGNAKELKQRMAVQYETEGHYMKPDMVGSHMEIFVDPEDWETNVVPIDSDRPKEVVLDEVIEVVREIIEK
ncbi:hypothetical protein LTR66_013760 [Elasticomyces elasticus]|nr:hypothetical protein LTR66_013760 [Elasticomyces elasticus]KAK4982329.1 hypothetical protein LTR50_007765 [Elasticomyces elasticus]